MRKILLIVGLTILLSLAIVGVASANNGPHGGYSNQTDACAGCHRAHTSTDAGGDLLVVSSIYALCTTCHGSTGSGANTDVLDGLYIDGRTSNYSNDSGNGSGPLNGGGFLYMGGTIASPITNAPTGGTKTTSAHNVAGMDPRGYEASGSAYTGETAPAWGGGQAVGLAWNGNAATPGSLVALECTSCHNPHGSTNYRILNDYSGLALHGSCGAISPVSCSWYGSGGFGEWQTYGANAFQDYQVISQPSDTAGRRYSNFTPYVVSSDVGKGAGAYIGNYTVGMNKFCGTCHQSYLTDRYMVRSQIPGASSARNWPNAFGLMPPYAPGNAAQTTMFPEWSTDAAGYYADDGTDAPRYRHAVGYSSGITGLLMPARYAASDEVTFTVAADGSISYANTPASLVNNVSYPLGGGKTQTNTYQTCLTCHYAHGTTADMGTGFAVKNIVNGVYVNNTTLTVDGISGGVAPSNDSALLFRNGRGVCQNCHKKGGATYTQAAPQYNNN